MTDPDFRFNHKTREVRHCGKAITLCKLHADIFACLLLASEESPIGIGPIARSTGMRIPQVPGELRYLGRRLKLVSIRIAVSPRGRWLIFEEVPKWQPTIAPPVSAPGNPRW
jgi:hypothetical protein